MDANSRGPHEPMVVTLKVGPSELLHSPQVKKRDKVACINNATEDNLKQKRHGKKRFVSTHCATNSDYTGQQTSSTMSNDTNTHRYRFEALSQRERGETSK